MPLIPAIFYEGFLKPQRPFRKCFAKLWSMKNISACLASGMWAETGTEPNFAHKLYFTELGNISFTQKPLKVELLTLAGTGAGSERCWAQLKPLLSSLGATAAPNFTGSDVIQASPISLCLPTLPYRSWLLSVYCISKATYHILDHQVSRRKCNRVRRCWDWQHECIGASYCSWYH